MDRPFHLALLAEAYVCGGEPNNALTALDEAFAMVRDSRTFFYKAELYRMRSNVLKDRGAESLADVDTCLQQALEAARRYETRSLERSAALSLARFWGDSGKRGKARELVAGVYNGFTEGSGTADLREANPAFERTTGFTDAIDRNIRELVPNADPALV
jgi:predicted ATPase